MPDQLAGESADVFEIVDDQWLTLGLRPGACVQVERRPPRPGELVVARVNNYLILGYWIQLTTGGCALGQPGRVIRLTRPRQARILGVLRL